MGISILFHDRHVTRADLAPASSGQSDGDQVVFKNIDACSFSVLVTKKCRGATEKNKASGLYQAQLTSDSNPHQESGSYGFRMDASNPGV